MIVPKCEGIVILPPCSEADLREEYIHVRYFESPVILNRENCVVIWIIRQSSTVIRKGRGNKDYPAIPVDLESVHNRGELDGMSVSETEYITRPDLCPEYQVVAIFIYNFQHIDGKSRYDYPQIERHSNDNHCYDDGANQ